VALCALAVPASAAPRRTGRVVRVERPRLSAPDPVHVCPVGNPAEGKMICYGQNPPEVGAKFTLIDDHGIRGQVVVREVARSTFDACQLGTAHDVTIEVDEGSLQGTVAYNVVAVRGVEVEEGGRVLPPRLRDSPSGRPNEHVWSTIDRDGDAEADMLGTAFDCEGEVPDPPPAPPGRQKVAPVCIDYWTRDSAEWTRVGRDLFFNCM
jgi:hypothetical protein